jgi:hypothetical protein
LRRGDPWVALFAGQLGRPIGRPYEDGSPARRGRYRKGRPEGDHYNASVRIALVPLDSRPPNWQFPQRLADIAGVELAVPPRGELGTLHSGADGARLARWLADTVSGADGGAGCDAAVFSWDALIYGGLVQSRSLDTVPVTVAELLPELGRVDWSRVRGYAYLTIPRLGISIDSAHSYVTHKAVREYFILSAQQPLSAAAESRLRALQDELGERTIRQLWSWR